MSEGESKKKLGDKENSEYKAENSIFYFLTIFIISFIVFICIIVSYNASIKKDADDVILNTTTAFSNSMVSMTNIGMLGNNQYTNISRSDIEEFTKKINETVKYQYDILEKNIVNTVRHQTDMFTFWFAFLSLLFIIFTLLGVYFNNNILNTTKQESKSIIADMKNNVKDIDKKLKEMLEKSNHVEYQLKQVEKSKNETEAISLFNQALDAYINRKDNEIAMKLYSEALKLNPNYAEAYNNRGILYSDKYRLTRGENDFKLALNDYDEAIKIINKYTDAYNNKGVLYYEKWKMSKDENDYNNSRDNILKAKELNPNNVTYISNLGELYHNNTNERIKEEGKRLTIQAAKLGYNTAIEYCKQQGWDYTK